ncbi:MAG: hypothetical protein RIA69_06925 [Cyclobacteriaceae bacterium]
MLDNFNESELKVASKLMFDGLSMAKSSMEMILQSPISLEKVNYSDNVTFPVPKFETETNYNVHIIKTELMGDLKGTSYLIFSDAEVNKIFKACLPEKFLKDNSPENELMKMGFLTEIDNMVAASVITEFSNSLNLEIYGMVPTLEVKKSLEVNRFLENEAGELDHIVHFKANFHGTELDIAPDFLWILHEDFIDKIKDSLK